MMGTHREAGAQPRTSIIAITVLAAPVLSKLPHFLFLFIMKYSQFKG